MPGTENLTHQLEQAPGLPALLAAAWDAFEFIAQAAPAYDDPDSTPLGYAFMLATTAACRGRNALACAPSLPANTGGDTDVSVLGNQTQAAAALADLAALIGQRLSEVGAMTAGHDDQRACGTAVAAAAEIRFLLTGNDTR